MIRYLVLLCCLALYGCASDGIGQKTGQPLVVSDPHQDLEAATDEALPYTLVRRSAGAGAAFTTLTVVQFNVKGINGDTQFASARADVPVVLSAAPAHQFQGRGHHSNHIEVALSSEGPTTITEPKGYPPGSEIKLWAIQDKAGEGVLLFDGPFVDHSGKGLAVLNSGPDAVDFYHWYLRANGTWWCEVHN